MMLSAMARHEEAVRPEHTGELRVRPGVGGELERARRAQPRQRVECHVLGCAEHPTHVRLAGYPAPIGTSGGAQTLGGKDRGVGGLERRIDLVVALLSPVEPEVEALVHRDVERRVEHDVGQPWPLPG